MRMTPIAAGAVAIAAAVVTGSTPVQAAAGPYYTPGTIYFSKTETAELTYPAGLAAVRAVTASPFKNLVAANATEVMVKASSANVAGQCVKISDTGAVGTYGGNDGDGYCQ